MLNQAGVGSSGRTRVRTSKNHAIEARSARRPRDAPSINTRLIMTCAGATRNPNPESPGRLPDSGPRSRATSPKSLTATRH